MPSSDEVKRAMSETRYHHGDLRASLEREARALIREGGLGALSLRKLADRVGVSPPALYHHFRDKNDLLCAIAERGFEALGREVMGAAEKTEGPPTARLRAFVFAYVRFATREPETYDLMFGREIWKRGAPTASLREVAYGTFRSYAARVAIVAAEMELAPGESALRLAQASWALLHGLCRLQIDGIYVDASDVDAMCEEAVRLLTARFEQARLAR